MKSSKQSASNSKKATGKVETPKTCAPSKEFGANTSSDRATAFRFAYERSDLPIRIDHTFKGPRVRWTKSLDSVDYDRFLPLFFEGLREKKFPYDLLAEEGVQEMISSQPDKVLHVIPYLIQPLKMALKSNDSKTMIKSLKILQKIALEVPNGGEALVPYYRQLLPVLMQHKTKNRNLGDGVDYGQRRNENLADLIEETLNILEINGGPDAFINIRYVIPLYESCTGSK